MNPTTALPSTPDTTPAAAADAPPFLKPPVPAVYQSMLVVSLLGALYKRHEEADLLHEILDLMLPNPLPYYLVRALALGMGGDYKRSEQALEPLLAFSPDDEMAKVVISVAKVCSGEQSWMQDMESVLASASDPAAREFAANVVGMLLQMKK
jgi:hypothetical protein